MKVYIKNYRIEDAFRTQKEIAEKLQITTRIINGQVYCDCPESEIPHLIDACESIDRTVKIYKRMQIN